MEVRKPSRPDSWGGVLGLLKNFGYVVRQKLRQRTRDKSP